MSDPTQQRDSLRKRFTIIVKTLDKVFADRLETPTTTPLLDIEINLFKKLWDVWDQLEEIEQKIDSPEDEESPKYLEQYFEWSGHFQTLRKQAAPPNDNNSTCSHTSTTVLTPQPFVNPKIKPYTGDISDWPAWWARFKEKVWSCPIITDIDRVTLLRELLPTPDARLLPITNYDHPDIELIERFLEARYYSNNVILHDIQNRVVKLPKLPFNPTSRQWREFLDVVLVIETAQRNIDALSTQQLCSSITRKLPPLENRQLYQKRDINIRALRECVETGYHGALASETDQLRTFEIQSSHTSCRCSFNKRESYHHNHQKPPRTAVATTQPPRPIECLICSSNHHKTNSCQRLRSLGTVQERTNLLRLKQVCYKCLNHRFRIGHRCTANIRCAMCNRPHHELMCYRREENGINSAMLNTPENEQYDNPLSNIDLN